MTTTKKVSVLALKRALKAKRPTLPKMEYFTVYKEGSHDLAYFHDNETCYTDATQHSSVSNEYISTLNESWYDYDLDFKKRVSNLYASKGVLMCCCTKRTPNEAKFDYEFITVLRRDGRYLKRDHHITDSIRLEIRNNGGLANRKMVFSTLRFMLKKFPNEVWCVEIASLNTISDTCPTMSEFYYKDNLLRFIEF